jgi:hypothetical protein
MKRRFIYGSEEVEGITIFRKDDQAKEGEKPAEPGKEAKDRLRQPR